MYKYASFLVLSLFLSVFAHAASDDFIIRSEIISVPDVTPPSVPGSFSATPVATSQIDLAWSSSTDNILLSGYQVFRDAVQIATTTATNYSDTGLTESTLYTYYVTAYDSSANISASSTVVSTTTLTTIAPNSSEGTRISRIELESLEIIPSTNSVTIRYETKGFVRTVLKWGETASYELGSIGESSFSRTHETHITGLTPGEVYEFTIEGENARGRVGILTVDTFTTLLLDYEVPPANATNIHVQVFGKDLLLSWDNPSDVDFEKVRVLRSDIFYPTDTADGWLVYEGGGTFVSDIGVAIPGTRQYYTIFSYDTSGNVSSGAVVSIYISVGGFEDVDIPDASTSSSTQMSFMFDDILFIQNGLPIESVGNTIDVDGTQAFSVSVPYDLMPRHLKTIVVDIFDQEGNMDSYLLRADEGFEYYSAVIGALSKEGRYAIKVSVFDFKTYQIGSASGEVVSTIAHVPGDHTEETFLEYVVSLMKTSAQRPAFWGVLFVLFFLFFLFWRRGEEGGV